ncbi:MAG: hypothetical protein AAF830_00720 [Pseudomonadota bacterium]
MSLAALSNQFENAHGAVAATKKHAAPYSIRFTEEERAQLNRDAGGEAWSRYIRRKLFGDGAPAHRVKRIRRLKRPSVDQTAVAKLLAALGQSRLSQNMNQIAKASNMGALPVTPELEEDLHAACAEIALMRQTLIAALGIKPETGE